MSELRILSKIQDLKNEFSDLYNNHNGYHQYWEKEDYDLYNKDKAIFQAKIKILMEILQNE
tara:strand:- start:77 stop:259 length:183 start_codon:yes stop_codon:yes gene_type:complete